MSDAIQHECGIALLRLKKPLDYYQKKYGTSFYGLNKMYLLMEKQHNRGQDGAGIANVKLDVTPGKRYISRKRSIDSNPIQDVFKQVNKRFVELENSDPEKLKDLRPTLPALMSVLFEPFLMESPYHVKDWRMSERFDQIVGDMKWWFRSSAPPRLIFLMRTLHGLTTMLKRLDVSLPWQFIMDKILSDIYPQARSLALPEVEADSQGPAFDSMAQYMKVHVVKSNGNKISLTMPGRCADDIEDVMDEPVLESIRKQNIDLQSIQDKARKSGFVPQVLFELHDEERDMKVWLE